MRENTLEDGEKVQYTQEITLDLDSNTAYTTVGAKQGDNNSREVRVHITNQGQTIELTENYATSAYFRLRKPDGKAIINACEIVRPSDDPSVPSNYVKIVFTAQTLAVAGRAYADITLMQGSSMVSTVSFIVIIMASPSVAGEAISSNEFGLLNAVVEDATHTIYEAQAWAEGKRGSVEVFGEHAFNTTYQSTVITTVIVSEPEFLQAVGSRPGLDRTFVFTYVAPSSAWTLDLTTIEGDTSTISPTEAIGNLSDYYITISITGADSPNDGDTITIHVQEPDEAYNNNAKYYAQQTDIDRQAIENMTVTAENQQAEFFENDVVYFQGQYVWYNTKVSDDPEKYEVLLYQFITDHAAGPWNDSEVINQAIVEKTINNNELETVNLHFKVPQGPKGDVNFLTFDIDTDTGNLMMKRPNDMNPDIYFYKIGEWRDDGQLYFKINQ